MHTVSQFPPGYRFSPTDEELILYYLKNKASYKSIPAQVIQDMDASEFYSRPPWDLVGNPYGEREWYFFIYQDEHFHGDRETNRIVEKGVGFWKLMGDEDSVYDSDGDVFAFKTFFTYFSRFITNEKKTHWRMELYRLPTACSDQEQKTNEWVLVRITRGIGYTSYF